MHMQRGTAVEVRKDQSPLAIALFISAIALLVLVNRAPAHAATPDTPAPARFLPEWDNLLLSHDDRTRVVAGEHRARLMSRNGILPGTVLADGFVSGIWTWTTSKRRAALTVTPFARWTKKQRAEIEAEGARLIDFLAPGLAHAVSLAP